EGGWWARAVTRGEARRGVRVRICFGEGPAEELVPRRGGRGLGAAYKGPKACFWAEGASHYNVRQRGPAEYLRRLRDFFQISLARQLRQAERRAAARHSRAQQWSAQASSARSTRRPRAACTDPPSAC